MAGAGAGVSLCLQGFAKRTTDVCQMLAPFPHVCQPAHDKQCPSDVYGGQSGGEDKCAHAVDEVFPYHLPAYDVSACGCCRLAERADKEVDVSGAAGLLGATESLPAAHAESVGLVHVEQHIAVPAFQFCQGGQVGLVAVHAEDAFGDDDDLAKGGVVLFEQPFQLCQIVVAVADAFGGRQADAVNQAGMDELVGKYQRLCIAYGGQDARVGMIPAVEHQCGFRAEKVCQFGFQLFVNGEVARQQPGRRRGGQERVGGECAQEFLAQGPVGCQP
ncbi:hypothetical protein BACSTE_00517 [Bacteroides stercoris ATCC 43183]|uniref:Uncharacterized protein n=1 Tax=Bacteroides stercoris ATCC 43183 TaxID=449673 RepID=B0NM26_BACSE|nr:hypothetical protein BACSTE_00517 [Bacteroides stercoris ATCC 43183]